MANPYAGEVAITLDGDRLVMKLTLGALAELEASLGETSLVDLVSRFEEGQQSARDIVSLIAAGLRGGGWQGSEADLLQAEITGGISEAAKAAALLLLRAFSMPDVGST